MSNSRLAILEKIRAAVNDIHQENRVDAAKAVKKLEDILRIEVGNNLKALINRLDKDNVSLDKIVTLIHKLENNDKTMVKAVLSNLLFRDELINGTIPVEEIQKILNGIPDTIEIQVFNDSETRSGLLYALLYSSLQKIVSDEEFERVFSEILTSIPDTFINIQDKIKLIKDMDSETNMNNMDIAYVELVRPVYGAKTSGDVSLEEFIAATKDPNLDASQFILLTLGVMQTFPMHDDSVADVLDAIRKSYVDLDYESALEMIAGICKSKYSNNSIIKAIASVVQHPVLDVEIEENFSRRYFENRLAAVYHGRLNQFESIDRIARYYLPKHEPITSHYAVMQAVSELAEAKDAGLSKKMNELKNQSSMWKNRGRYLKSGFATPEKEKFGEKSDTILNSSGGVMKSIQPNFPDELLSKPIRSNQADIHTFDLDETDSYPVLHPRGAYAASLSGHTFLAAALLLEYAETHRDSKTLEVDINNYIKSFVSRYISHGYHGLTEVLDVFNEPHIKAMFKSYGVKLDYVWSKEVLDAAFQDTQTYTKQLCMKAAVHAELRERFQEAPQEKNREVFQKKTEEESQQGNEELEKAVNDGDEEKVEELLEEGADVNQKNDIGNSLLHLAALNGNREMLKVLLSNEKIDIQARSEDGRTALFFGVNNGDVGIVQDLLKAGANPDLLDNDGDAVLHIVAMDGNAKIMQILLAHGANPFVKTRDGQDAMEVAEDFGHDPSHKVRDLLQAAMNKDYEQFYHAAEINNVGVLNAFLEKGVDINKPDADGYTALHWAAIEGSADAAKALLAAGADVNILDKDGNTSLHMAVSGNNADDKEVIKILLSAKADAAIKNNDGQTAMDVAEKNRQEMVAILKSSHSSEKDAKASVSHVGMFGHASTQGKKIEEEKSKDETPKPRDH